MRPLVVAVSGTSGAGKSTLVADLTELLQALGYRVEPLHFDDFTDESDLPAGDLSGWLARGAVPDEWRTDGLEGQLRELIATLAEDAGDDGAASVVLVEEPFGRARSRFGRLVDLSVHLQLPLHLALARRLLRQFVPAGGALDESATASLRLYLDRYLADGAEFYRLVEAAAMDAADVILDGQAGRDETAKEALAAILEQLPRNSWGGAPPS